MQHGLADPKIGRSAVCCSGASLLRVGCQLSQVKAQWVLCHRHIELVEHDVHTGGWSQRKAEFSVELVAFCMTVIAVTIDLECAVIRYDPDLARSTRVLPVAA